MVRTAHLRILHPVQRGKYIQSRKANMYVYMFFILQLERNPEQQGSVCVKLSGDGARFSKPTSLTFLTFSFLFLAKDVLAGIR